MTTKYIRPGMSLVVALMVAGCGGGLADEPGAAEQAVAGEAMPRGAHFNLNLIGKDKEKTATDCAGGHVIFVPLSGTAKIGLAEGEFSVLDCNGTDGQATFQLPNPDPDNDGTTAYSVWARALGKPGGGAAMTPCATDAATGELYCSLFSTVLVRGKGKSSFTNVSRDLLYVFADVDADGIVDRLPLFDSRLQDYFWNLQNDGLRLAQLRFYEVPTTVQ